MIHINCGDNHSFSPPLQPPPPLSAPPPNVPTFSLHQSSLVVGSHEHGEYSLVSRAETSSGVRAKLNTWAFSRMRECVTDLGRGTNPWNGEGSVWVGRNNENKNHGRSLEGCEKSLV